MKTTNLNTFKALYIEKLTEAVTRHPGNYCYDIKTVPEVADRMIEALLKGRAHVGPAIRATCKTLRIEPSAGQIKAYLTADVIPESTQEVTKENILSTPGAIAPVSQVTAEPIEKPITMEDAFINGYIETALWSSTDDEEEPLDKNYSRTDLHPETIARMIADCTKFTEESATDLHNTDVGAFRCGHDFWLTRNGHGAGFWDGDYEKGIEDRLTDSAKAFGEYTLYVAKDHLIYGM